MKLRLALTACAVALTAAPLGSTAHAFACNEQQFPEACAAWYAACGATNTCRLFG